MAITVKHSKVSAIPDGTDTTVVRPSDWNADHALTGVIDVANGGTGAATLTGYVKGNGTSAMTASATVPSGDITGLGTMSTQNANAVAVTGGAVDGTTIGATTPSTGAFSYASTNSTTSTTPALGYNASNASFVNGATIAGSYLQNVMQNKSGTAGASTNFAVSNDLGTDSTYYGEFGMNSSVYSSGTPADFFSINNGVYFSGHDGDITLGSGNGYKTYLAWGTTGQSAHVINATGAIGLNTNITGTTNFGTSGQVLTSAGSGATPTWTTPSGGVTGFTSGENTTAPNATVYVDYLQASAASTNADVALIAKGTGATLAQIPDNATTGGNKRGTYATDWQKSRSGATQVASSPYSFVGGGASNSASTAATGYNVVVGGANNQATGDYSFVGGGGEAVTATNRNTASGTNSVVVGGWINTASGTNSFIGGGKANNASTTYTFIGGGFTNVANSFGSSVIGGYKGTSRSIQSNIVFPLTLNNFDTSGASQSCILGLSIDTTDATATVLRSNTSAATTTNQVILPDNSAYYFKGEVISGVTGGGNTKGWTIEGVIKRGAGVGTTALVGSTVTSLYADAGAATWTIALAADTTNGGLKVTFTGQASTTIRTVCKIQTTEMTY